MKLNRKILMVLSIVLSLAMATGGTLAYLTDRDSAANVFTVGNVDIKLNEAFEPGAALVPGVQIEKAPTIENVGKNDAWVWLTFSIPSALDNWTNGESTDEGSYKNVIHWNPSGATTKGYVTDETVAKAVKNGLLPEGTTVADVEAKGTWDVFNKLVEDNNAYQEKIDGIDYNTYVIPFTKPLAAGDETWPGAVTKVFLDANVDIAPNGDFYKVVKGEATPIDWNINDDGSPVIYVGAYAIQKEGFETYEAAVKAYVDQWSADGKISSLAQVKPVINAAPESGAVRPAGYAPSVDGEDIDGLYIVDNSDEVTNLRALYRNGIKGDINVSNSYLDGTYALNLTADSTANAALTVSNTTLSGWTSYSGFAATTFTNCTFKVNSEGTYNFLRAYNETTLENCELKGTTLSTDNGKTETGATITLKNCTYNGVQITDAAQIPVAMSTTQIVIAND